MISKAAFRGTPHLGVFCVANDDFAFLPPATPRHFESLIKEALEVSVVKTTLMNSNLIGTFAALNSKIAFLPLGIEKRELAAFRDVVGEVILLEGPDAIGNLIAMNDNGIACSSYIYGEVSKSAECKAMTIAKSALVGSTVFVTNNSFLCHRDSSAEEVAGLESLFKSKGSIGTVNFSDPFVRSGLVGNRHGIVAGVRTSGPELARIDDVFVFD
ncbi:translation initiation factor IF-6 [archaeon]|nr:translation initiation factor IF-6 [archaeon]